MNLKSRWVKVMGVALVAVMGITFLTGAGTASAAGPTPDASSLKAGRQAIRQTVVSSVEDATEKATGLTADQIKKRLREGSSLADIITDKGGNVSAVEAAAKSEATDKIQKLADGGKITQKQADRAIGRLDTEIDVLIHHKVHRRHPLADGTAAPTATPTPAQ